MKLKTPRVAHIKAGPADDLEEREFIVYPSTFTRTPDSYGDVVAKGAFAEDIAKRKENGISLPGLFGHNMYDPDFFVASATDEEEDDHGWRVRGIFDDENPKALQTYRLVQKGLLRELSFAYDVLDEGAVQIDGVKANELRKLETHEFSFVPIGANRDTGVVGIKALSDALVRAGGVDFHEKIGRAISAKNEGDLKIAHDAIGRILKSLEVQEEDAADDGAGDDEAANEAAEKASRARAALKLRLETESALAEL